MRTLQEWKQEISRHPDDVGLRRAYADWLEERGDGLGAAKQREKAGLGFVYCRLRNKRTGRLYQAYRQLGHLKNMIRVSLLDSRNGGRSFPRWIMGGAKLEDLEVVWTWTPSPVVIAAQPLPEPKR